MKDSLSTCILVIRPLHYQGEQALQGRWPDFLKALKGLLLETGIDCSEPGDEGVILIEYGEPYAAITSYYECLDLLKKQKWHEELGAVPIQVIFHLQKKKEGPADFFAASAPVWSVLDPERPYLSRSLKLQWEQLLAGKKLPTHRLSSADGGLFTLDFSGDLSLLKREKLFPNRYRAAKGGYRECYYCGMSNHVPAQCPSKLMTMQTRGIYQVGYLPLVQINELFGQVMENPKEMLDLLTNNVDVAQIRENPALQVYLAYFDIGLIYQQRFLGYSAFSIHTVWDGSGRLDKVRVDSRTLYRALDCLRVGQYKEASDLFVAESQVLGGKQFYAMVGQAFIALERGRLGDMGQHLQLAANSAASGKERIYISLLLSRYYSLAGHSWKAEQAVQAVSNLYIDCLEVQYRNLQTGVAEGLGQQHLQLVRKLVASDRRYFIAVLMDAALLPISSMVENILATTMEIKTKEAGEQLAAAREQYAELKSWFGGEDEELEGNLRALDALSRQYERKSCFDILDVWERAKALTQAVPRLRELRLEELNAEVDKAALVLETHGTFWREYPHQPFFHDFQKIMFAAKRHFIEARSVAGKNLAMAKGYLKEGIDLLAGLVAMTERMLRFRFIVNTIKTFGKKLLWMEVIFVALILLAPILLLLFDDLLGPDLLRTFKDPQIQKKSLFVVVAIIAPILALGLTIRVISETGPGFGGPQPQASPPPRGNKRER